MKKSLLFLLLLFAATVSFTFAQTVVFSDNFDSYTAGSHLAQSNSAWTTWGNAPGSAEDGLISAAEAASAPNSLYISGSNDQVYPFGNYTSGHYSISFNYYVPSYGNGAYFNVQHILLSQWALECYFNNNGTGYLNVGGYTYNFTYPSNSWFSIVFNVDMDNDLASLTINNVNVHTWSFHFQSGNQNGINQLAGINFYAGSPTSGTSGTYYVDDFVVTEESAAMIGQFLVNTESIMMEQAPNQYTNNTLLSMSNPGTGPVSYYLIPIFDIPNPNPASTGITNLHYYASEDPYTNIGFTTHTGPIELAIHFLSTSFQTHIGKTLNEIDVFLGNDISLAKVRVYDMGNSALQPGPGEVLYEQSFVPDSGWNHVQLTNPVVIDGRDLWIGVWFEHPSGGYPIYLDGSPADMFSAWYKLGQTWYCQFTNYDYNLMIGGKIDGTPILPWLSTNPTTGTINPGDNTDVAVRCNTQGMNIGESYSANIRCFSSDLENSDVLVPVMLNITNVSVNDHNQIEVTVYPNPASDYVQVKSENIEKVEIFNMLGQQVFGQFYGDNHVVIPTTGMAPGSYVVKVTTTNGNTSKQVIIK